MTYRRIRSLSRGIEVVRYLNTVKGAHPAEIGRELGLPRPTVHRILETLEEMELVYQGAYSGEFRLTPGVTRLVGGEDKFSDLRSAAWPVMRQLTADLIWPVELAIFHANKMLIIESTHRISSLSFDLLVNGQSRPMLESSLGRAYLSRADTRTRKSFLARLNGAASQEGVGKLDLSAVEALLENDRRNGFSMCADLPQGRCASFAVPVCTDGEAVASLGLTWQFADMTFEQARDRLAGPMKAAEAQIATQIRLGERCSYGERLSVAPEQWLKMGDVA